MHTPLSESVSSEPLSEATGEPIAKEPWELTLAALPSEIRELHGSVPDDVFRFIHQLYHSFKSGVTPRSAFEMSIVSLCLEVVRLGDQEPHWYTPLLSVLKQWSEGPSVKRRHPAETFLTIEQLFKLAWVPQTAAPVDRIGARVEGSPGYGQGGSTAYVANQIFGGKIQQVKIDGYGFHYWNVIGRTEIDFTAINRRPGLQMHSSGLMELVPFLMTEHAKIAEIAERSRVLRERMRNVAAAMAITCYLVMQSPPSARRRSASSGEHLSTPIPISSH